MHVGAAVAEGRVQHAAAEHDRAQRRVRAAVEDEVDRERRERAVGVQARAVVRPDRVALGREEHVLMAVVDDLHRPAALEREQRAVAREQGRELLLAAERAADRRLADADLLERQPERGHELRADVVRALQAALDQHAAVRLRRADHALRLDVELLLVAGLVGALDHVRRRGERALRVALHDRLRGERMQPRAPGAVPRDDLVQRQHRGQGVDLRLHVRRRLAGEPARRRGNQRQRLAAVLDGVVCEERHVEAEHVHEVLARDVGRRHDADGAPVERGIKRQAAQAPARDGRAHDEAVPRAGRGQVVDVAARAPDLLVAVPARHAPPHLAITNLCFSAHRGHPARPQDGPDPRVRPCGKGDSPCRRGAGGDIEGPPCAPPTSTTSCHRS